MENTAQQQPSIENLKSAISEIKSLIADNTEIKKSGVLS